VISPAADGWPLVLTFDGKGIVMLPGALRPATAKAVAAAAAGKLATRLSPGEKNGRTRMAELACVYDAAPVPRTPKTSSARPCRKEGRRKRRPRRRDLPSSPVSPHAQRRQHLRWDIGRPPADRGHRIGSAPRLSRTRSPPLPGAGSRTCAVVWELPPGIPAGSGNRAGQRSHCGRHRFRQAGQMWHPQRNGTPGQKRNLSANPPLPGPRCQVTHDTPLQ